MTFDWRQWAHMWTQDRFAVMLGASLLAHVVVLGIWALLPKQQVVDIPVRAISLRFGAEEGGEAAPVAAKTIASVAPIIQQSPVQPAPTPPVLEQAAEPEQATEPTADDAPVITKSTPRQFVRQSQTSAAARQGSGVGTGSGSGDDVRSRYTQLLSQWIDKHKTYPSEARQQQVQGEAIIRIRIDRSGRIQQFRLEQSTGNTLLDDAVVNMIQRSNPVPAVPENYPSGFFFEFLIPIRFALGR